MLFKRKKEARQVFTQGEREAIVDLLHLCLYADAHISLKEGEFIEAVIEVIGWDTNLSFSSYEARSIASAREARSKKEFIEYAATRLTSNESKTMAFSLCSDLMKSDGATEKEASLLAQIRGILGVY
jgi:hypothetical protein